ncbi:MAG: hypothetical protein QM576_04235 [Rhodopseudomonas sp.]|nr:hypothetical protein [Rhodopseudomonas sp. BR0M22]
MKAAAFRSRISRETNVEQPPSAERLFGGFFRAITPPPNWNAIELEE